MPFRTGRTAYIPGKTKPKGKPTIVTSHKGKVLSSSGPEAQQIASQTPSRHRKVKAIMREQRTRDIRAANRKALKLLKTTQIPPNPHWEIQLSRDAGTKPVPELKKTNPTAFHKAETERIRHIARQEGLKEDPLAELAISTAATAGLGAAAGALGRAGGLLAKGGARLASTEATLGESAAEKGAKALLRKSSGAVKGRAKARIARIKETPARVRSAPARTARSVKAAPRTAKQAVTTAEGRSAALKGAGRKAYAHPVGTAAGLSYGAHKAGIEAPGVKQGSAFVEGHVKALEENPVKTLETTGRAIPGIIAAPAAILGSAGASVVHGTPKPLASEVKKQGEGLVHMGENLFSGNPKRVQKAVENEVGLSVVAPLPAVSRLRDSKFYKEPRSRLRAKVAAKREVTRAKRRGELQDFKTGARSKKPREPRHAVLDTATGEERILRRTGKAIEGRKQRKEVAALLSRQKAQGEREGLLASKDVIRNVRRSKLSKGDHNIGDTVATIATYGISRKRDRAMRQLAEVEASIGHLHPDEIPAETITDLRNIKWLREHPQAFSDSHFWKAVDAYKRQAKEIEFSKRKKVLAVGDVYGIARPEERLEAGVYIRRKHLAAAREAETLARHEVEANYQKAADRLRKVIKTGDKAAIKTAERDLAAAAGLVGGTRGRALSAKLGEAKRKAGFVQTHFYKDPATLERKQAELAQLRADANSNFALARKAPPQARARHEAIGVEIASRAKKLERELKDYRQGFKQAQKDYTREAQATIREKGLEQPAYVKDIKPRQGLPAEPSFPGARSARKQHMARAEQARRGSVMARDFETLVNQSIAEPRMRRAMHRATTAFVDQWAQKVKGKRYLTSEEISRAINRGELDPKQYAVLHSQFFKQAILDPHKNFSDFSTEVGKTLDPTMAAEIRGRAADAGNKYVVVPREAVQEFVHQMEPPRGLDRLFGSTNRFLSRTILGYSPAWAVAQLVAEGIPASIAIGANPARWARVAKFLTREDKRLSKTDKAALDATVGESAGVTPHPQVQFRPDTNLNASRFFRLSERNRIGRALLKGATGDALGALDRYKGGKYRKAVVAARADKELNGWVNSLSELMRGQRSIADAIKGKPLKDQMEYIARHPKEAARLEHYLDDVMGNWRALTRHEAKFAPLIVFYPFVRYSLRWMFWSFPKNHPVKASILYFLGQQNANELEKLTGSKNLDFLDYTTPVYTSNTGKQAVLPGASRIAPGTNALVTAIGSGNVSAITSGFNPAVGTLITATTGVDPFTGEQTAKSPTEHALLALNQLLSMPAPVRYLHLNKLGEEQSASSKVYAATDPNKDIRSLAFPFLPQSGEHYREAQQFSDAQDAKYSNPVPSLPKEIWDAAYNKDWRAAKRLRKERILAERGSDKVRAAEEPFFEDSGGELSKEGSKILQYITGQIVLPAKPKKANPFGLPTISTTKLREQFGLPSSSTSELREQFGLE